MPTWAPTLVGVVKESFKLDYVRILQSGKQSKVASDEKWLPSTCHNVNNTNKTVVIFNVSPQ